MVAQPDSSDTAAKVVPLVGTMTGMGKEVLRNIRRGAFSGRASKFLLMVAEQSFGNAGYQRQNGKADPGASCEFDLATWAAELGWHKPDVLMVRKQVCELGVISFEPTAPGEGVIRWSFDFTTWKPLDEDYRRARYTRQGAGRPKQASVSGLNIVSGLNTSEPSGVSSLITEKESNYSQKQIKLLTDAAQVRSNDEAPSLDGKRTAAAADARTPTNNEERRKKKLPAPSGADVTRDSQTPKGGAKPKGNLQDGERDYRSELLEAVKPLRGAAIINHGQEWAAAGRFFKAGAVIETVVELWKLESQRPKWDSGPQLTLAFLATCYSAYLKSPDNYRASIGRSIKGAKGEYDKSPGQQWQNRPAPAVAPHRLITAADANPFKPLSGGA